MEQVQEADNSRSQRSTLTRRGLLGAGAAAALGLAARPAHGTGGDPSRTSIAFMGDSLTARAGKFTAGVNLLADSHVYWTIALTHGRVKPLVNAGVAGQQTTEMVPRFEADVLSRSPGIIVLAAGVNDVKGAMTSAQTCANLAEMIRAAQGIGAVTIVPTITPSDRTDSALERLAMFEVNRWILDQASQLDDVIVIDWYPMVSDPSTVAWASGLSADGTHPSALGGYAMGKALAQQLNATIPPRTLLSSSNVDPFELLPNPMMVGDLNGVPTNVTVSGGSGVATKIRRTDGILSEWMQWEGTGPTTILQDATSGFAPGDLVVGQVEIESDGPWTSVQQHFIAIEARGAGNVLLGAIGGGQGATPSAQPSSAIFFTNPFVVPQGTVKLRLYDRVIGGPARLRIGRMCLRKWVA